jgi:23S rRNA pseudouridine2605 synthase
MARAQTRSQHRGLKGSSAKRAAAERLQKVLSQLGLASRREAEDWIRAGRLTVNGQPATLGVRVSSVDKLQLDGRPIRQRDSNSAGRDSGRAPVFLCHRSPGENLISGSEGVWVDRLPRRAGRRFIAISPMPRVDGGVELVTADGGLAARLQRAVHQLPSEFSVRVRGALPDAALQGILDGTLDRGERLDVEHCEPGGGEGANRWYTIVARGGSGKDVRQLFERQGALVSRVLRTRIGPIVLERQLARGKFRELSASETGALLSSTAQA